MSIAAILRDVTQQQKQWYGRLGVTDPASPNLHARQLVLDDLEAISATTFNSSSQLLNEVDRKREYWLLKAEAEPASSPLYFTYLAASATYGDILRNHQETPNG